MSIPLDKLYHYVSDMAPCDTIIYRWQPHGSKNIANLCLLRDYKLEQLTLQPMLIAHDQEPLDINAYADHNIFADYRNSLESLQWTDLAIKQHLEFMRGHNIKIKTDFRFNIYDQIMLLHSESRSQQLDMYKDIGMLPVYWWSHGVIARDWYRYAEHDISLASNCSNKIWLIYVRAWTGTREYRLHLLSRLVDNDIHHKALCRFGAIEQGQHYKTHKFANPMFRNVRTDLNQVLPANHTFSAASADYDCDDYRQTAIELVCETLFDDSRLHLTEKICRPIACGKPFLLCATLGSLQYLRDMGFQTFHPWIDESYDNIADPLDRIDAIVKEMKRINQLCPSEFARLLETLYNIAEHNRRWFFSGLQAQITSQLWTNLQNAVSSLTVGATNVRSYLDYRQSLADVKDRNFHHRLNQAVQLINCHYDSNGCEFERITDPSQSSPGGQISSLATRSARSV